MSLLRFNYRLSGPVRLFFPSFCLLLGTSLIGAVPLAYLLVPLFVVFLLLSFLVIVEVIRETGPHGALASPQVQADLVPIVACQMLRSTRCRHDGARTASQDGSTLADS